MAKQKAEKTAAVVTINKASIMTKRGRKEIADWLRRHADWLVEHGAEYSPRFRGRYIYSE